MNNRKKAREYFGIVDKPEMILHHKDPNLKYTDPERYDEWRPEDLQPVTRAEHMAIHSPLFKKGNKGLPGVKKWYPNWNEGQTKETNPILRKVGLKQKGKVISDEARQKMSDNHADFSGDKNPMYGKSAVKGKHWKLVEGKRTYYD